MNKEKGVVEKCLLRISDPFTLVVLAAYRSQELASGITPCVPTDGSKDALVSLKEISSGNLDMASLENRMVKSLQKFAFLSEDGLSPASGPAPAAKTNYTPESAAFGAHALFQKVATPSHAHDMDDGAVNTAYTSHQDHDCDTDDEDFLNTEDLDTLDDAHSDSQDSDAHDSDHGKTGISGIFRTGSEDAMDNLSDDFSDDFSDEPSEKTF